LSTLQLRIPPLRERPQEILLLAQRFAAEAAAAADRGVPAFTDTALRALMAHSWPGNIRELRNVISQAVVFCEGDALSAEHLGLGGPASLRPIPPPTRSEPASQAAPALPAEAPLPGAQTPPARRLDEELRALERARIVEALEVCGGNQTKAAELLQMPRRTLVSRMTALGIPGRRQLGKSR
jgi:DNA-binding NtrC family response regulator